jgi:type I restriction enzyme, S subunit
MELQEVKLDEIKSPEKASLVSGPFGSNIGSRFFHSEGIPVIRGNNLSVGSVKFIDDGFVFITEEKAQELKNCKAIIDDIIFTATGTLGQIGIIPNNSRFPAYIISNKQLRLRLDTSRCYPLYIYYYLSSPPMRSFIASQNKGSSVPLLTLGIIRNIKIFLPRLETQKIITAILSAYDDLIENNKRRITLLEKMAEEIYREWFVRFRFPGHEQVKFEKGVPEGWETSSLGEIADFTMGQSPKSEFYNERGEGLPFNHLEGLPSSRAKRVR